jgi:hypothetical protein
MCLCKKIGSVPALRFSIFETWTVFYEVLFETNTYVEITNLVSFSCTRGSCKILENPNFPAMPFMGR